MRRYGSALALGLVLSLAMGMPQGASAETQPLWEMGFGFGGLTAPDYRGSDEQRGYLLPVP